MSNIAPTNGWLEYYFPIGEAYFQGRAVSFREGQEKSLGGGNSNIFLCSPLFEEMIQFDEYFSHGLKPPTRSAFLPLNMLNPNRGLDGGWGRPPHHGISM